LRAQTNKRLERGFVPAHVPHPGWLRGERRRLPPGTHQRSWSMDGGTNVRRNPATKLTCGGRRARWPPPAAISCEPFGMIIFMNGAKRGPRSLRATTCLVAQPFLLSLQRFRFVSSSPCFFFGVLGAPKAGHANLPPLRILRARFGCTETAHISSQSNRPRGRTRAAHPSFA
jgi:hypothetical protein